MRSQRRWPTGAARILVRSCETSTLRLPGNSPGSRRVSSRTWPPRPTLRISRPYPSTIALSARIARSPWSPEGRSLGGFERMGISRWYWTDPTHPVRSAGRLFSPLDEELGLLPGEFTPLLHERLVQVGTLTCSFAEAASLFSTFTGTSVSEVTVRRYTERVGAVLEGCVSDGADVAAEQSADNGLFVQNPGNEVRWVGADGVFVRTQGGWREVRTVTIGDVDRPDQPEDEEGVHCRSLSYFSRLTDGADVFIDQAKLEFSRRAIAGAGLVGAGSDGAVWCQELFDRHCPEARRVLDFYHAAERVSSFSRILFTMPEAEQWNTQRVLSALKREGPEQLLQQLRAWSLAGTAPVKSAATSQLGFFESRTELLDYPGIRDAGLPIGTGNAESANRHVIQERMKGPGMFWGTHHVNPMLALRCASSSGRWTESWEASSERLCVRRYPVRTVHQAKEAVYAKT